MAYNMASPCWNFGKIRENGRQKNNYIKNERKNRVVTTNFYFRVHGVSTSINFKSCALWGFPFTTRLVFRMNSKMFLHKNIWRNYDLEKLNEAVCFNTASTSVEHIAHRLNFQFGFSFKAESHRNLRIYKINYVSRN